MRFDVPLPRRRARRSDREVYCNNSNDDNIITYFYFKENRNRETNIMIKSNRRGYGRIVSTAGHELALLCTFLFANNTSTSKSVLTRFRV